jgi:hypothetical protein
MPKDPSTACARKPTTRNSRKVSMKALSVADEGVPSS